MTALPTGGALTADLHGGGALDRLMPLVYEELRIIAHRHLARRRRARLPSGTVATTSLVNEAYLRLVDRSPVQWRDRAHFLAMASRTMRRVLIDYANQRGAAKRGGGGKQVELPDDLAAPEVDLDSLLELNDALQRLEAVSPRQAKAVELRFFGGLTLEEAAEVLETSAPTVMRDLRFAQAWLAREMGRGGER